MYKLDYVEENKDRYFVFVAGARRPNKKHKTLESAEIEAIRLMALTGSPTWVCKIISGFFFEKKPDKDLTMFEK
jgi:hypothetical protein